MMSNFDTPTPEKVPQPTGYRILVRPLPAVEKTKGGIILTDRNKEDQAYLNSVGQVIAMGSECYSDRKKPWCSLFLSVNIIPPFVFSTAGRGRTSMR